jgi:hypothetical protein
MKLFLIGLVLWATVSEAIVWGNTKQCNPKSVKLDDDINKCVCNPNQSGYPFGTAIFDRRTKTTKCYYYDPSGKNGVADFCYVGSIPKRRLCLVEKLSFKAPEVIGASKIENMFICQAWDSFNNKYVVGKFGVNGGGTGDSSCGYQPVKGQPVDVNEIATSFLKISSISSY